MKLWPQGGTWGGEIVGFQFWLPPTHLLPTDYLICLPAAAVTRNSFIFLSYRVGNISHLWWLLCPDSGAGRWSWGLNTTFVHFSAVTLVAVLWQKTNLWWSAFIHFVSLCLVCVSVPGGLARRGGSLQVGPPTKTKEWGQFGNSARQPQILSSEILNSETKSCFYNKFHGNSWPKLTWV